MPTADPHDVRQFLAELSDEEKIALLHQCTPAVPRLGLAEFHTGAEALHGVAWVGIATVFPQSVGLAASWDTDLLRRIGTVVSTELRAKRADDPDVSLNAWAPVVNPLRHPRWGRNEEGYSEDPHLTAELATAFTQGLRGDHDQIWRTVPTLKHFLGYNNEQDRDVSSSTLRRRVLHEYELPAFRGPIEAGSVGAVMPSYNLVNGRPAHVSQELLELMRSWTPNPVLVVSDAFAPTNLADAQQYFVDHVESHAATLHAGIDSFTDNGRNSAPTIARITDALDRKLITMADVEVSVERLLRLRALTGEFSPADDPYSSIDGAAIDQDQHRQLAREAVGRSVVLLRNDGLLPLSRESRTAVVGPMARRVLTDWYSGTLPYAVSIADALTESMDNDVTVAEGYDIVRLFSLRTQEYLTTTPSGERVLAGSPTPTGSPDFALTEWGEGIVTLTAASGKLLTVVGGRIVQATADRIGGWEVQESFRMHLLDIDADDGDIDGGQTVAFHHLGTGRWLRLQEHSRALEAGARDLDTADRFKIITVRSGMAAAVEAAAAAEVVIIAVGNDPHLHGRETEDRPHLRLPAPQAELVIAIRDANPRSVLVIISSYPYVLDAVAQQSPAIVWSSHGGQELGHGLVDVLVGDREPYGHLAQTWVASEDHVADIFDYDIISTRSTYWYSPHAPLFGFGHGLSYTTVAYDQVRASVDDARVLVQVQIANTGARPVSELVQVYTDAVDHRLPYPRRLAAHRRVELAPGQSELVELEFEVDQFAIFDVSRDRFVVEQGRYRIDVGNSSTAIHTQLDLDLTGEVVPPRDIRSTPMQAIDFDDLDGIEIAPRSALEGEVIQLRHGLENGWILFRTVDLTGIHTLELTLRSHGPGTVTVTESGDSHHPILGTVEVADAAPDWHVCVINLEARTEPVDLILTLTGGIQLDTLLGKK